MNDSQTSSNKLNRANLQRTNGTNSEWYPPSSFSIASEGNTGIFLVDKTNARQKQSPQPFSLTPMNDDESLALSAWDDNDDIKYDAREENSVGKNSVFGLSSNTVTYDDDNDDTASVATCSTATTTTTSSDHPPVLHVTLADLIRIQERRNSMQKNINNYNKTVDTTAPVVNKSKQKVNFKDEIVELPVEEPLKNSVDLPPRSNTSNDSSTVKDNNSSYHDEISITPSLGPPKISQEEFENAKLEKQKILRGWVKCLWPQPRLPSLRQLATKLNTQSLLNRHLNPLTVGVITTQKSSPMILTFIVKGTNHVKNRIERNGQIKFVGSPIISEEMYDPREYLLLHCPTYHNPPYINGDPRAPWNDKFLLNKVLPRLADEATRVQNEVGLYLTVRETLLRGLGRYPLYKCKVCQSAPNGTFTYDEIQDHLLNIHKVKNIFDEEMIRVNPKIYMSAFYKSLPPKIV